MSAPMELLIPINEPFLLPNGRVTPVWWQYLVALQFGLTSIDLSSQVTGILPYTNGGTSHDDLQFTTSGATNVTLPTTGTLINNRVLQASSVTTGSVGAGASAVVTVTWPVAFADTNYSASADVLDTTAAIASLSVIHIEARTTTTIDVRVFNNSAGNITGTVLAIGLHG